MVVILVFTCSPTELQAKKTYRIKKLFLNAKQKKLFAGSTYQLKVKRVKPSRATKKVKWKSANQAVASVNKKGLVTAKKAGATQITATSKGSKKVKAKCKIVVVQRSNLQGSGRSDNGTVNVTPVSAATQPGEGNKTPVPVVKPTEKPGEKPTGKPEINPTEEPGEKPTEEPGEEPTKEPGEKPTKEPGEEPTEEPAISPTEQPTMKPTTKPTGVPDISQTEEPVINPTEEPEIKPTKEPEIKPTEKPVIKPTKKPEIKPTKGPEEEPTKEPEVEPTKEPIEKPDTFTVVFVDYDGSVIETKEVKRNETVTPPKEPMRKGYKFTGWDKEFDCVTSDLTVTAQYEEDHTPTIFVRKATALPGENAVEVEVCVRNNPGILGMTLSVSFDESALTLIDAENGEAIHDVLTLTKSKVLKSGCKFVWDGQELTNADIKDGTILVLVFNVSETAQSGEYQIVVNGSDGDIIDNELIPVSLSFEDGYIKLSD